MTELIEAPSVPISIFRKPAQALIATGAIHGVASIIMFFVVQERVVAMHPWVRVAQSATSVLGLIATAVILYGAVQMLRVENYEWSFAAGIAAIVGAILSPTFITTVLLLPSGVWALYILRRPQSKSLFAPVSTTPIC
jgi:hypothetical protein